MRERGKKNKRYEWGREKLKKKARTGRGEKRKEKKEEGRKGRV